MHNDTAEVLQKPLPTVMQSSHQQNNQSAVVLGVNFLLSIILPNLL